MSVFGLSPCVEQRRFRNMKPLESEGTNVYGAVVCYTKLASRAHIFEYPRWVLSAAFDYQMSSVGRKCSGSVCFFFPVNLTMRDTFNTLLFGLSWMRSDHNTRNK